MRTQWISGMVLCFGLSARAQECAVTVYVKDGGQVPIIVLLSAKEKAAAMFREIGVQVRWRNRVLRASNADTQCGVSIEAVIETETPDGFRQGALAYALPWAKSGTSIHIFFDRVRQGCDRRLAAGLLAHVLAHEITHVIEAIDRHSTSGLMKAHWNSRDFQQMEGRGLPFADIDVHLIHQALDTPKPRASAE
jgi:hypothetical protein